MTLVGKVVTAGAVVTVLVLVSYGRVDGPTSRSNTATAPVVVAQRDMPEGATIDRMAVAIARWPVGTIPVGAFTSIDSVASRVTRVPVFKGEALVPGRLAPDGTGPGLQVRITPGKRASSFRIDKVTGTTSLIQPNSRVDIYVNTNIANATDPRPKLVLKNMRVLAIGAVPQRTEDGRAINASVATVEVTPEEAELLALATTQGSVQLVLRGYGADSAAPPPIRRR